MRQYRSIVRILLLTTIFSLVVACSDDNKDTWQSPPELTTIKELISKNLLLKEVIQQNGTWTFCFETQNVIFGVQDIQSVVTDPEKWTTLITFPNEQTLSIPTQGTSIASFIDYIKVNPSGFNPLAARVRLNLPCGGRIRASVIPKKGCKTEMQEHLFAYTHENTQFIDVLGLYPDYTNKVKITFTDKEGNERAYTTIEIKTESLTMNALPVGFYVKTANLKKMEPGLNLVSYPGEGETDTSLPYMVDADGEIRWILDWSKHPELKHIATQCSPIRLKNGNYLAGDANHGCVVEVDVLGNLIHKWSLTAWGEYTFHHEITEAPNGNLVVAVSDNNARLTNGNARMLDHIIEFNPQTESLTHVWDLVNTLDSARHKSPLDMSNPENAYMGPNPSNWLHNNGVTCWGDNDFLATARWQGLFKYSRAGNLKWIIAPHNNWRASYQQYLLTPLDKNGHPITDPDVLNGYKAHPDFDWVWGVHCPIVLPNGYVMAFDNGHCRHYKVYNFNAPEQYSRIVIYKVNEKEKTVQQIWQYGLERGRECFASFTSSVQYLPQMKHVLFCPSSGNIMTNGKWGGRIIEIDPQTNEVVFELEIENSSYFHRANRLSLYPDNM